MMSIRLLNPQSGNGNLQQKRAHCFVNQVVYVNIASQSVNAEAIDIYGCTASISELSLVRKSLWP